MLEECYATRRGLRNTLRASRLEEGFATRCELRGPVVAFFHYYQITYYQIP